MTPNQIHSTVTWPVAGGLTWAWSCEDCPATSGGYATAAKAKAIAAIHEDPSRNTQGSRAAATKNRKKKTEPMKKTITTAAITAAVLLLASCGTGKAGEAVANAPRPTVTVTAPAKPAPTVTTTTTQNVATVPQSCLDALDNADQAIATAGEGFSILSDALTAAGNFDTAGIEDATTKLTTLNTDKLTPALAAYKTARDTCKAAG